MKVTPTLSLQDWKTYNGQIKGKWHFRRRKHQAQRHRGLKYYGMVKELPIVKWNKKSACGGDREGKTVVGTVHEVPFEEVESHSKLVILPFPKQLYP